MSDVPMPGEHHPALDHLADDVRELDLDHVAYPVHTGPPEAASFTADAAPSTEVTWRQRVMTRRIAFHRGLLPAYGAWAWSVWTDELGRHIADRPDRTRWVPDESARFVLPPWNPGPTFRSDDRLGWVRVTGEQQPWYGRDREACDICAGTGTDYLGRPCRVHGGDR